MMEGFFRWCSQLSSAAGFGLLALVGLIMLMIPFWRVIMAFFRHVVLPKKLAIESFRYHFFSLETGEEIDEEARSAPDFILNGSVLMLSWKVEGAWRVDVDPIGRNLLGNAASIVFSGDCLQYTLKAHGFFCRPIVATLEVPLSNAYRLEKKDISRSSMATEPLPPIRTTPLSSSILTSAKLTLSKLRNRDLSPQVKELVPQVQGVGAAGFATGRSAQRNLYKRMAETKILRSYSFSTRNYPNSVR